MNVQHKRKIALVLGALGVMAFVLLVKSLAAQQEDGIFIYSASDLATAWQGDLSIPSCAGVWQANVNAFANFHADGCNSKYGIFLESAPRVITLNSQLKDLKIHFLNFPTTDGILLVNYDRAQQWTQVPTLAFEQWITIPLYKTVKSDNVLLMWEDSTVCYGQPNNPCPAIDQIQWSYSE